MYSISQVTEILRHKQRCVKSSPVYFTDTDIVDNDKTVTEEVIDNIHELYNSLIDKSFVPPDDVTIVAS